ncbi:hypothetical protein MIR68_005221 [Amoeboaphelidium protococcarum]|nr:hypothetical protein MIR68_005221 [Amoeboaphelidium protococcarum]
MTGQIPFNQRKVEILKSIDDNDKSVKQSIDVHALPIVNLLNDMNQFVTTSSCSGRISIVAQPSDSNSSENNKMKKKASEWIYASHDLVDDSSSVIELMKLPSGSGQNFESVIYFKMEPFVLHVEADSVQNGEALLKIALQAGYRNSGLTLSKSRVMVGIRHTMKLDVPIGNITADGTRRLMVTDQYLEWLLQIANQKMQSNFARMQILYDAVANQLKVCCN